MKTIITGGLGLLGRYLMLDKPEDEIILVLDNRPFDFPAHPQVLYHKCDITDFKQTHDACADFHPDRIIHCAGIHDPKEVERNVSKAQMVNVYGSLVVWVVATQNRAHLCYISSNGIYDGDHPPYSEQSVAAPINEYGRQKVSVEHFLYQNYCENMSIVRPTLLYGALGQLYGARTNFALIVVDKLQKGEKVYAYDDVYCKPLYAGQAAEAIWKILAMPRVTGSQYTDQVFNLAGRNKNSIYQFALIIAEVFELDKDLIKPISFSQVQDIPRPKDTTFDTSKMEFTLGMEPLGMRLGLKFTRHDLNEERWI